MSMKSTPSSTARRSTRFASSTSFGGPQTPGPVSCMLPKPRRWMVRSPMAKVSGMVVVSVTIPSLRPAAWTPRERTGRQTRGPARPKPSGPSGG